MSANGKLGITAFVCRVMTPKKLFSWHSACTTTGRRGTLGLIPREGRFLFSLPPHADQLQGLLSFFPI